MIYQLFRWFLVACAAWMGITSAQTVLSMNALFSQNDLFRGNELVGYVLAFVGMVMSLFLGMCGLIGFIPSDHSSD